MDCVRHILIGVRYQLLGVVYRDVIERLFDDEFATVPRVFTGHSCDEVVDFVKSGLRELDLALIDFELEVSRDKRILNGLDLALFVRNAFPDSKILFLVSTANVFLVKSVIQEVDPHGILEKKNLTSEILSNCIKIILNGGMYYGQEIREKRLYFLDGHYFLDEWDRRMLYELSLGANRTQLAKELPFSISTIARRKRRLKEYFGVDGLDDRALVGKAREMGFL